MKITIVTAVYNRAATIGQALESVAAQSYDDVEHLVIDGASNDGTLVEINKRSHPRLRVISEPDYGIYDALNKGIKASSGDVVGLMHSDDFFAHDRVLEVVARSFAETGADAVYGNLDYISATNTEKVIRRWNSGTFNIAKLARGWMPPHPTLYLRREVFDRLGYYDTDYQISADYDAMLRWLVKGRLKLAYIPEVLVKMRVGGESNRSLERIIKKSREDYRAIRKNGVGGLGTLAMKNLRKINQLIVRD